MSDPGAGVGRMAAVAEPSPPQSLERTRLLLTWLRAQRAVDRRLSELLAAGPAGERRVGTHIDEVNGLVAAAASAYEAYRSSVTADPDRTDLTVSADVINLRHRSG